MGLEREEKRRFSSEKLIKSRNHGNIGFVFCMQNTTKELWFIRCLQWAPVTFTNYFI